MGIMERELRGEVEHGNELIERDYRKAEEKGRFFWTISFDKGSRCAILL